MQLHSPVSQRSGFREYVSVVCYNVCGVVAKHALTALQQKVNVFNMLKLGSLVCLIAASSSVQKSYSKP